MVLGLARTSRRLVSGWFVGNPCVPVELQRCPGASHITPQTPLCAQVQSPQIALGRMPLPATMPGPYYLSWHCM